MKSVRRPLVAVSATLVLVVIQAVADPTGLLALVGWSGAQPSLATGVWTFAPYVVFVPVLLGVIWWAAMRAGDRYWTLVAGVVLAVLLAQAATCLVMTWNLAVSAWAAGYVVAKAVPAALIIAAFARWFGGRTARGTRAPGSPWVPAALFAASAPLLAGVWWTSPAYAPGVPVARADHGALSLIIAVLLLGFAAVQCLRWMRSRVPGVLGGWLAALVAGGIVGMVQAIVAFAVDGGLSGDLWPGMAAYVAVADGLSFGACLGWIPGLSAVLIEQRVPAVSHARVARIAASAIVVVAMVVALGLPAVATGGNSTTNAATAATKTEGATGSQADAAPAGFLRATGRTITDGRGDQVLLRGVNVNQLVDFYKPRAGVPATRPLTEADFAGIAGQGFNVVRLNLSWSALEPQRGTLNQAYVAKVRQAVAWAHRYGLYIVLDMHQDGWSKAATPAGAVCRAGTDPMWGYDGAPAWATLTDGAPRCQFTGRDISPAGDRAFENFYFDTDGVQSALVATWGKLAAIFRDQPTVAGYDLLNEPGFGETAPVTTSYLLGRFYDRAIGAIRSAGSRQLVFVEPSILWSGLGFDSGPTPGFTTDGNIVFSPHLYAESITLDRSLGLPPIVGLDRQFRLAERVADEYNAPLWSGEYGYWGGTADVDGRLTRYAKAEDANMVGGAYWVWKQACGDPQNGIGPTGNGLMVENCKTGGDAPARDDLLSILGRAYPRATPGTLTSLSATGPKLRVTGDAPQRVCGLDVWVPGTTKPQVSSTGLTAVRTKAVPGGWTVTGCARGRYSLDTSG